MRDKPHLQTHHPWNGKTMFGSLPMRHVRRLGSSAKKSNLKQYQLAKNGSHYIIYIITVYIYIIIYNCIYICNYIYIYVIIYICNYIYMMMSLPIYPFWMINLFSPRKIGPQWFEYQIPCGGDSMANLRDFKSGHELTQPGAEANCGRETVRCREYHLNISINK